MPKTTDELRQYRREYYLKNREKIKARASRYQEENKETRKEYLKDYHERNKDRAKERFKKYSELPGIKEQARERAKKHYEENKDRHKKQSKKWAEENRGRSQTIKAKWREKNQDYSADREQHLKKVASLKKFFLKEAEAKVRLIKKRGFSSDHIIPIRNENVSGLHVPWNIQAITVEDNKKKMNSFDGTCDNNSWRIR